MIGIVTAIFDSVLLGNLCVFFPYYFAVAVGRRILLGPASMHLVWNCLQFPAIVTLHKLYFLIK